MRLVRGRDRRIVILTALQLCAWAAAIAWLPDLRTWTIAFAVIAMAAMICTNFQVIAHNQIHNPIFRSPAANSIFSILNSFNLGVPSALYVAHHLNHHQFGNGPGDLSALRAHGLDGREEAFWRYALLSPLRTDFVFLAHQARRLRLGRQLAIETIILLGTLLALAYFFPRFMLTFYVPAVYFGQVLAAAENYLEHMGGDPADPERNSVSAYSKIYNRIWLNNGYHQEHHLRPRTHWSDLPLIRGALPPDRKWTAHSHWRLAWQRNKTGVPNGALES